jgi:SAM-dependent methyltransferase
MPRTEENRFGGTSPPSYRARVGDLFDAGAMYDADYLHFWDASESLDDTAGYAVRTSPPGADIDLIWRLLDLRPGMQVLDLACGHGPLANRLAARGCRVTGLDSSTVFLDRARADAKDLGVEVDYVVGDMRDLPWENQFDRIVNWSTAFGYFDDTENRRVVDQISRALRPGGRLIMDLNNLIGRLVSFEPSRIAVRDDGDMLADRFRLDPLTNRLEVERTIVRDGRSRRVQFVVRLFGFPELRDWLLAAGLDGISAYGEDGTGLRAHHDRMIVVAERTQSPGETH